MFTKNPDNNTKNNTKNNIINNIMTEQIIIKYFIECSFEFLHLQI